jgi:hypothetical protein
VRHTQSFVARSRFHQRRHVYYFARRVLLFFFSQAALSLDGEAQKKLLQVKETLSKIVEKRCEQKPKVTDIPIPTSTSVANVKDEEEDGEADGAESEGNPAEIVDGGNKRCKVFTLLSSKVKWETADKNCQPSMKLPSLETQHDVDCISQFAAKGE